MPNHLSVWTLRQRLTTPSAPINVKDDSCAAFAVLAGVVFFFRGGDDFEVKTHEEIQDGSQL